MARVTAALRRSTPARVGYWCLVLARGLLGLSFAVVLGWCVTRSPRGFEPFSWSFFEHQLFLPAFAVLAAGGALATLLRHSFRYALRDAFWGVLLPIALAVAAVGNTAYAAWLVAAVALAIGSLLAPRVFRAEWRRGEERVRYGALVLGASFGLLFVLATLAPRATTHPVSPEPQAPDWPSGLEFRAATELELDSDGFHVGIVGGGRAEPISVEVDLEGRRWAIEPAFEFSSYSKSGLWTVFDYRRDAPPRWQGARVDSRSVALRGEGAQIRTNVLVRVTGDELSVRSVTHVRREICAHLASALVIHVSTRDQLRVDGNTWDAGDSRWSGSMLPMPDDDAGPEQFVAYRHGRLALLRATEEEKGPFTTLATLADHDPWLTAGGFSFQIRGFARQAAREPSPTAGFGVSQAAILARYDDIRVELAATAIGRGWNTVRIAPGTYDLSVVLRKAR